MQAVALLIILFALGCQSTSVIEEKCVYEGSMCNIHPQRCLQDAVWRQCPSMNYPALYATKKYVELWVNTTDLVKYPANFTMSVVRSTRNGTMTALDNCCNLRISEPCTLPGFSDNYDYMIFAPTQENKYCSRRITARPGIHPKWCKLNASKPCLSLKDGIIVVDEIKTSISKYAFAAKYPTDYCYFNAPKAYVRLGNFDSDRLSVEVEGIVLDGTRVRGEDFQTTCTVVEDIADFNLSSALHSYNVSAGFLRCAFPRIKRFDIDWIPKPICATGENSNRSTKTYTHTGVIAGVASVTFLVLVIVSVLVCRRYLKGFFPSYNVSAGEEFLPRVLTEDTICTSLDKNNMTTMKKINEDCDNSQEQSVRYLKSFPNPDLHSSDGFEKVFVIAPKQAPQLHDKDSRQGDADDGNSTTVLNDLTVNDYLVSSAETALPPTDDYTRKEHPSLMPKVRMENTQAVSEICEDDKTTCSSTTDLNDNDTETVTLSSESIEKKNSTLNADNNFNYVSKSSLLSD